MAIRERDLHSLSTANAVSADQFMVRSSSNGVVKSPDNSPHADDGLVLYIKDVRDIPLLTHRQEVDLYERIAKATASAFLIKAFLDDTSVQTISDLSQTRLTENIHLLLPAYKAFESLPFEFTVKEVPQARKGNSKNKDGSERIKEGVVKSVKLSEGHDPKTLFESEEEFNNFILQLHSNLSDGKKAKNEFVRHNLRMAFDIAKNFKSKTLTLLDLIQEGNLGLFRAVEKFDATTGYKFSTYATWWIRQAITRALSEKGGIIRIPLHIEEALSGLSKTEENFCREYHRHPTALEASVYEFQQVFFNANNRFPTPEEFTDEEIKKVFSREKRIHELRQAHDMKQTKSLDAPLFREDGDEAPDESLVDFTEASQPDPGDEAVNNVSERKTFKHLEEVLSTQEAQVVRLRYILGLPFGNIGKNQKPKTVTRERIRQIHTRALNKLRRSEEFLDLADSLSSP